MSSFSELNTVFSSCILCVLLILPIQTTFGAEDGQPWSCENYYCKINCAEEWPSGELELEECERVQHECSCNSTEGGSDVLVIGLGFAVLIISVAVTVFSIFHFGVPTCKENKNRDDADVPIEHAEHVYPANFPELEPVDLTRPVNYLRIIRLVEREPVRPSELPPRYENTCTTSSSIAIKIQNEDDAEEDSPPPDYKSLYI